MNVINRQTFPLGKFGGDFGQIDRADQGVWKMFDDALPAGFTADDRKQCRGVEDAATQARPQPAARRAARPRD